MNVHTESLVLPLFAARPQDPARTIAAIWFQITDFSSWVQWLPNSRSVVVLDTGEVGRGSRLQNKTELGAEVWQVNYWDAGRRIVFRIADGNSQCACALETRSGDDHAIDLLFIMEFELKGVRTLMRPILAPIYARRARQYAENLRLWLLKTVLE